MVVLRVKQSVIGAEAAGRSRSARVGAAQVLRAVGPWGLFRGRGAEHVRVHVAAAGRPRRVPERAVVRLAISPVVILATVVGVAVRGRVAPTVQGRPRCIFVGLPGGT